MLSNLELAAIKRKLIAVFLECSFESVVSRRHEKSCYIISPL